MTRIFIKNNMRGEIEVTTNFKNRSDMFAAFYLLVKIVATILKKHSNENSFYDASVAVLLVSNISRVLFGHLTENPEMTEVSII